MTIKIETCTASPACWIIAYGNPQRGDDGIGRFVGEKLRRHFGQDTNVGICILPQLDLALLEAVQGADHLIFVDARMGEGDKGLQWSLVEAELNGWALGSHHLKPSVFLGLLQLLYECSPAAWLVSVPGNRFAFEEQLSTEARRSAEQAAAQIVDWLWINRIANLGPK